MLAARASEHVSQQRSELSPRFSVIPPKLWFPSHKLCTARDGIVLMSFEPSSSRVISPGEQELPLLHGNSAVTSPGEPGFPPKSLTLDWRNGEKAKVRNLPEEEAPDRGIAEAPLIIGGYTCPSLVHLSQGQIIGVTHSRWVTGLPQGEGQRIRALGIAILVWGFSHTPSFPLAGNIAVKYLGTSVEMQHATLGAILFLGMSLAWLSGFVLFFFLPI